MRILLDHCVDCRLARHLTAHQVKAAAEMDWEQLANGELLAMAANHFDVLLTIDKKMKHEQNLKTIPIAIVVLDAKSNRIEELLPFLPALESALSNLTPKILIEISL